MAGEAECQFNTNCWIRGRMVAMTGSFSGTFTADQVDVIESINIRNGAVSSYIQYSRKKEPGETQIEYLEWTIPAQPFGTVVDITIPTTVRLLAGSYTIFVPPVVTVYRNGQQIARHKVNHLSGDISLFASIRYIDFDAPLDMPVTYRVEITNTASGRPLRIWMKGKALTGIRKR